MRTVQVEELARLFQCSRYHRQCNLTLQSSSTEEEVTWSSKIRAVSSYSVILSRKEKRPRFA